METIEERIKKIEEEIRKTPYHKGTEHHIGKLKARIARLREEEIEKELKKGGGGGSGYALSKTGDASVVLVGPPSVGKSTLLNKLTQAESKVGEYDFTTQEVIPGMMDFNGAKIQIFDVPGIIEGAAKGKGRGRQVLSVARVADLIIIMVDVKTINLLLQIFRELFEVGLRLNEEAPKVSLLKRPSGGIKIMATAPLSFSEETIKEIAGEFRLPNVEITIRENVSLERLIDAFMGNRVYLPYFVIVNKCDLGIPENWQRFLPPGAESVLISAEANKNLDRVKEIIWRKLNFIRVYLKKDETIDMNSPFILKKGKSLKDLLESISICNKDTFVAARVYGPGAKYPGQEVSFNFVPQDETVVQFISRK
ncbi:MAG: OBG GTPase family GTP-binding protein [Microgenomates group bacterium]